MSRFYLVLIGLSVLAALIALFIEVTGVIFFRHVEGVFVASMFTLGYGVVGLCCAAVYERGKEPTLMRSGMIAGGLATACWLTAIFVPYLQVTMQPAKLFTIPTAWACFVAVTGGVLLLPMQTPAKFGLRAATIVMTLVLAVFIAGAVCFYPDYSATDYANWTAEDWQALVRYEEHTMRLGGVLITLTAGLLLITTVVGLLGVLTGSITPTPVSRSSVPYWFKCPRCNAEQQAMTGEHRCIKCRLRAKVELT